MNNYIFYFVTFHEITYYVEISETLNDVVAVGF